MPDLNNATLPISEVGNGHVFALGKGYYVLAWFNGQSARAHRYCRNREDANRYFTQAAGLYEGRTLVHYTGGEHARVLRTAEL